MNTKQLKDELENLGVNPNRVELYGGIPQRSEGLVLARDGLLWVVRHFERGSWYTLGVFDTEDGACEFFLKYASDSFYQS